jgi:hypothetical protein
VPGGTRRVPRRPVGPRLTVGALCAVVAAGAWILGDRGRALPRAGWHSVVPTLAQGGAPSSASARGPSALLPAIRVIGADRRPVLALAGRPGVPVRLQIPALHIDTVLDRLVRRPDGSLNSPPRWNVPGWYAGGPRPGEVGPAVIVGHIDSTAGPAIFFGLARLRAGDAVRVLERGGRVLRFVVADIERFPKSRFPTARVYGPQPVPILRIITCIGSFDRSARSYRDNLVVYAGLVGSSAGPRA